MLPRQLLILLVFLFCVFHLPMSVESFGGFKDKNPADFIDKAWKSVPEVNKEINGNTYFVPIKVLKARMRVVQGTDTELEVLFGESSCQKSMKVSEITAANCQFKKGGSRVIYKLGLWEKLWENFLQVTPTKIRDVPAGEII